MESKYKNNLLLGSYTIKYLYSQRKTDIKNTNGIYPRTLVVSESI